MSTAVVGVYRVLGPKDPGYDKAFSVDAQIKQYWSWFEPGFWAVTVHCRAEVDLRGGLPALDKGVPIRAEVAEDMQAVFEEDWQRVAAKGLERIADEVARTLQSKTATAR